MNKLIITYLVFIGASCSPNQVKPDIKEEQKVRTDSLPKIDSSNYYSYYSDGDNMKGEITTAWLEDYVITPILIEEMQKVGIEHAQDNILYKLTPNETILLTAYTPDFDFGFIYIDEHEMIPLISHRSRKSPSQDYHDYEFDQTSRNPGGKLDRIEIKKMPENIHLLQQDCYWYQFSTISSENQGLVSRNDAINILREDIRSILSKILKK